MTGVYFYSHKHLVTSSLLMNGLAKKHLRNLEETLRRLSYVILTSYNMGSHLGTISSPESCNQIPVLLMNQEITRSLPMV